MLKDKENLTLPTHIGIIMDGNGRWAKKRGQPRNFGHREGAKTFRKISKYASEIGIKYVTYYAFSTENWKRPKEEIDEIMRIFSKYLQEVTDYKDQNVRVLFIGDKSALTAELQEKMIDIEKKSEKNNGMTLILAINYGGRQEITRATKELVQKVLDNEISVDEIDEDMIGNSLDTKGIPDVDLIIRPSGEKRTSNFLVWQGAYSELYFSDILWPDFKKKDLDDAIYDYSKRFRRFGGL